MNRFIFGRGWVYQEEAGDDAAGAGGGGAGGDVGAADDAAGGGTADDDAGADGAGTGEQGATQGEKKGADATAGEKKGEQPADMKAAIDAALGYAKKPDAAVDDKTKVKPDAAAEEKHANGKPKKNEKGEDLDAEGKIVQKQAPKAKTSAELALSKEQLAVLKPEARARFHEMSSALKAHEGTITTLSGENKVLKEARDSILGVMEETKTTQDQLVSYLNFNSLLQSSNPRDWEQALQFVEEQRAALYKSLGREPKGGEIDLLKDFPDLAKQVADEEITRPAALEIANGRRRAAASDQAEQREQSQQRQQVQTAAQRKQASEAALTEIEKWTKSIAGTDLDYKAKEDKLLAKIDAVIGKYPPNLWLSTLQMMYEGIEIQKAQASSGRQNQPLRPSGAKAGDKKPESMLEAINTGLGYGNKG